MYSGDKIQQTASPHCFGTGVSIDWAGWIVWWNVVVSVGRPTCDVHSAGVEACLGCGARSYCHTSTPHDEISVVPRIVLMMNAGASSWLANEAYFLLYSGCSYCPPGFILGNPAGTIPIPPEFVDQAPPGFTEVWIPTHRFCCSTNAIVQSQPARPWFDADFARSRAPCSILQPRAVKFPKICALTTCGS